MERMKKVCSILLILLLLMTGCSNHATYKESTPNPALPKSDETVNVDSEKVEKEISRIVGGESPKSSVLSGKTIVIDAGHGLNSYNKQEAIAPNSSETKIAFASGTAGSTQTEEQLNLSVALLLEETLKKEGAVVYMTRTTHESDMTNIDRAEFANELHADISVKIHADGNNNQDIHGVSVLVPGSQYITNEAVLTESKKAGELVLEEFAKETGAYNRGISVRNDMTGFNWTKVPIILIEMGFMTNPHEDSLMATTEYQQKMLDGIINGLKLYFEGK